MENEVFWERVEALRLERSKDLAKEISMAEISAFAFMHRNAYGNSKKAKSTPGIQLVDGAARRLNVCVDYLITGFNGHLPYIPNEVPQPARPEIAFQRAQRLARDQGLRSEAVTLVLSQKPDPRLGADRLLLLFYRADRWLAQEEENAAAQVSKAPKKKAKRATP